MERPERNDSLLFSPNSDLDLLAASLGLMVLLAVTVGPALAEIATQQLNVALLLGTVVGVPCLINLLRYKRAPWGCAVLPAGFFLYLGAYFAGFSGVTRTLLLGAPNALFLAYDLVFRPLRLHAAAQAALAQVREQVRDALGPLGVAWAREVLEARGVVHQRRAPHAAQLPQTSLP